MREQSFEHDKLKKLVEEKKDLVNKGRKLSEEIEKKQENLQKLGLKVQKVKDKVVPIVEQEIEEQLELGDFEEIYSIDLEDDKVVVKVNDRVEEFKENYLEQKKKQQEQAEAKDDEETEEE